MTENTQAARNVQIVSRWNAVKVLFSFDVPTKVASGMEMRAALKAAASARADLRGADLRDAALSGAYLSGAILRDADLSGSVKQSTPEESIAALDKVAAIILDNSKRLEMGQWHETGSNWRNHSCAEETACETTHCLAGWLQVCSTDPDIRSLDPQTAGTLCAPVASKMFFKGSDAVLSWLKDRKYVAELEESAARKMARDAKRAGEVAA